MLVFVCSR